MNYKLLLTAMLLLLLPAVTFAKQRQKVLLADPFILYHDGLYYAYGTGAPDGIEVYTSRNLRSWERRGLALHRDDVWGDHWFWAPEVYEANGTWYMYFTAEEHICVATADSPLGPFRQKVKKPMIEGEKCIDNTLFRDDDGRAWLFFDRSGTTVIGKYLLNHSFMMPGLVSVFVSTVVSYALTMIIY